MCHLAYFRGKSLCVYVNSEVEGTLVCFTHTSIVVYTCMCVFQCLCSGGQARACLEFNKHCFKSGLCHCLLSPRLLCYNMWYTWPSVCVYILVSSMEPRLIHTFLHTHTFPQINGVDVSSIDLPDIIALLETETRIALTLYRETSMTLL